MTEVQHLSKEALHRRANASIATASILSGLFSLFALVPISIRQRDWKIWVIPFASAFVVALPIYDWEKGKFPDALGLLTGPLQGGIACLILRGNKEEALRVEAKRNEEKR